MRVLYAGDGKIGEAANYLLGVLRFMRASVTYVPSGRKLALASVRKQDVLVFSDYAQDQLRPSVEAACVRHIQAGGGFLMIGGWGSFSAKYGLWHKSPIAAWLPVECIGRDDRTNLPTGALVVPKTDHAMFRGLSWKNPPIICGVNRTRLKPEGRLLWEARVIHATVKTSAGSARATLSGNAYPLLAVHRDPALRVAAFTADVAPHWCGGLVDWGARRLTLPVNSRHRIEVGDQYARFLTCLIRWLGRR